MSQQPQVVRAIIFNQESELLMMERFNNGRHYLVLVGGHIEQLTADLQETPEEALIREVFEETRLVVRIERLLYMGKDSYGEYQHVYLCQYVSGSLGLSPHSPEAETDRATNQLHRPRWCTREALQRQEVYPRWLLKALDKDMWQNFKECPRELEDTSD